MKLKKKVKTKKLIREKAEKLRLENLEMLEQAIPGTDEYERLQKAELDWADCQRKNDEVKLKLKEAGLQYVIKTVIQGGINGALGVNIMDVDRVNPIAGRVEGKLIDRIIKMIHD